MTRPPLPRRRRNETRTISYRGQPVVVTVGFDAAGVPREVFANGHKEGSDMQHVLSDACVVVSIALQHGIGADELGKSLGAVPAWIDGREGQAPASPIGAVVGCLMDTETPALTEEA